MYIGVRLQQAFMHIIGYKDKLGGNDWFIIFSIGGKVVKDFFLGTMDNSWRQCSFPNA